MPQQNEQPASIDQSVLIVFNTSRRALRLALFMKHEGQFYWKTGRDSGYLFASIVVKNWVYFCLIKFEILSSHLYVLWVIKWSYCCIIVNIKVTIFGHPLTMHYASKMKHFNFEAVPCQVPHWSVVSTIPWNILLIWLSPELIVMLCDFNTVDLINGNNERFEW